MKIIKRRPFRIPLLAIICSIFAILFIPGVPVLAQSITASETSGPVGTWVSVTGSSFSASTAFQTYFAYGTTHQVAVGSGTVSSTGTLTSSFNVPSVPGGTYTIRVQTATNYAVASFVVTPEISLNVDSAIVGNQITVTGTGFRAGRTVTIRFDNAQVTTSSTNSAGSFVKSFTVPETYRGTHTVTATDGSYTETASLLVVESMTISPTSGAVGTTVTISGTGFRASRQITIRYDGTSIASVPSTITTNNVGTFSAKLTVPAGPARTVQIVVNDGTNQASASFKLTAAIGLTPTSGKVGTPVTVNGSGFNANRQVSITFDDEQVRQVSTDSLGSFTTNFEVPQATGGQHPVVANDGVRSVSSAFTIANNMIITPNSGKVGTPMTVSGSGFRANRTVSVHFDNIIITTTQSDSRGSFSATFNIIVGTGGSHVISTSDGVYTVSGNFMIQPGVILSQTSGKMGAQVNITGTGFDAGRTLAITLGSMPLRSTTTDASGSFSDRFTVPQMDVGSYNLNASDGTNMASIAFAVTSSFNISPTTGYVGSTVTIKGGGYNGLVTIKYDDDIVANAMANADGSFSTTFVVPASIHGYHTITASDTMTALETAFSMESTPPPVPIVMTPQGISRENARPVFTWQGVTDPSGVTYTLQIASDASFNTVIMEKEELTGIQYTIQNTEKLKATGKETPYYWRVKAIDLASNESQWSTPGSFYVSFMADWVKYTLIGLGAIIGALLIFWLGMIVGRRGWTKTTQ